MEPSTNIETVVMKRVYRVRAIRRIGGVPVAFLLVLLSLYGVGREVWVARVFENMPADLASVPGFFLSAFLHTELLVQILALAIIVSAAWLVYDLARALYESFAFKTVLASRG